MRRCRRGSAFSFAFGTAWFSGLRSFGTREATFSIPSRLAALGLGEVPAFTLSAVVLVAGGAWLLREAVRGRPRIALGACLLLLTSPWLLPWYAALPVGLAAVEEDAAAQVIAICLAAYLLPDGLVGLARWHSRFRVPFAFSAALGLAVITVAHGGVAGTPLAGGARRALDGALQLFRNVHKFDPAVRIAVAVGVAALFAEVVERMDRRTSTGATGRWVVVPACVVLVLGVS